MMANITFFYHFLLFSVCHSIHVAVNTWLNCSFFTLIFVTAYHTITLVFTVQYTLVQSAVLRSHVVRLSVCQGRDPNMCTNISKTAGDRVGYNGAPVENAIRGIKWSHAR